jgi:hypothetical protein
MSRRCAGALLIVGCFVAWVVFEEVAIRDARLRDCEAQLVGYDKLRAFIEFRDEQRNLEILEFMMKSDTPKKVFEL